MTAPARCALKANPCNRLARYQRQGQEDALKAFFDGELRRSAGHRHGQRKLTTRGPEDKGRMSAPKNSTFADIFDEAAP